LNKRKGKRAVPNRVRNLPAQPSVLKCENTIRFVSLKNRKLHRAEVLQHVREDAAEPVWKSELLARALEDNLRCFVPLSTYNIKELCQSRRLWLEDWQGWTPSRLDEQEIRQSGVWVPASALPDQAYLRTGEYPRQGLPEITRVQEAGWHLACYHYGLRQASRWWVEGPAGWLTLDAEPSAQTVVLPAGADDFLPRWLRRQALCQVQTVV
jgi:hypothetical protein